MKAVDPYDLDGYDLSFDPYEYAYKYFPTEFESMADDEVDGLYSCLDEIEVDEYMIQFVDRT